MTSKKHTGVQPVCFFLGTAKDLFPKGSEGLALFAPLFREVKR